MISKFMKKSDLVDICKQERYKVISNSDIGTAGDVEQSVSMQAQGPLPTIPTEAYDALVLDGRLRQSLVTIRSLGSRGKHVAALETVSNVPAFSSRWCQRGIVCPAAEGTEAYLAYLEQVLDSTGTRVLISSSDGTIAL